jgi:hypothetical protein
MKNYGGVAMDMKRDWSMVSYNAWEGVWARLRSHFVCVSTARLASKQNFTEYLLSDVFLFVLLVHLVVLASG